MPNFVSLNYFFLSLYRSICTSFTYTHIWIWNHKFNCIRIIHRLTFFMCWLFTCHTLHDTLSYPWCSYLIIHRFLYFSLTHYHSCITLTLHHSCKSHSPIITRASVTHPSSLVQVSLTHNIEVHVGAHILHPREEWGVIQCTVTAHIHHPCGMKRDAFVTRVGNEVWSIHHPSGEWGISSLSITRVGSEAWPIHHPSGEWGVIHPSPELGVRRDPVLIVRQSSCVEPCNLRHVGCRLQPCIITPAQPLIRSPTCAAAVHEPNCTPAYLQPHLCCCRAWAYLHTGLFIAPHVLPPCMSPPAHPLIHCPTCAAAVAVNMHA